MRAAWATDLHLPFADTLALTLFKQEVKKADIDSLFICGDISEGDDLEKWIEYLNDFFIDIYFCLGNHDFFKVCNIIDFQKKVLKAFFQTPDNKRHSILMAPRQCGKCVCDNELITIRDTTTGKISTIKMSEFFNKVKSEG